MAKDHLAQSEKRQRKLTDFDYGHYWAEISGAGPIALVTWGSATGAVVEAAERLTAAGRPARAIALRLIAPLRHADLAQALAGAEEILVVEQNQGAQLFHYLHAEQALPAEARIPRPARPPAPAARRHRRRRPRPPRRQPQPGALRWKPRPAPRPSRPRITNPTSTPSGAPAAATSASSPP